MRKYSILNIGRNLVKFGKISSRMPTEMVKLTLNKKIELNG
jgi:hypothetical protein